LCIAHDPELLAKLARAVEAGGATSVLVRDVQTLEASIARELDLGGVLPFRFVLFAFDGNVATLERLCGILRPSAQVIAMLPTATLASTIRLLAENRCNHVLHEDEEGLKDVTTVVQKFVLGDLFGIEKYVPPNTEVKLTRLRDYKGRTSAVDEVIAYAEKLGVRSKIRNSIGQVCEELLMNALYDAPIDESGKSVFAEVDVRERLDKLSPRPVSLRYASTETSFAVSVRDRFGRLDKATVLRYIDKCLHSADQIDRKTYGAGLGIYLITNAAAQFVLNIAPGMATEVICTFDRKAPRGTLRTVSVFVYPSQQQQHGEG
jgi:hypothetical protein